LASLARGTTAKFCLGRFLELIGLNIKDLEREIAERKKAEDALRESEQKYRMSSTPLVTHLLSMT
jgi:hypothetical protein